MMNYQNSYNYRKKKNISLMGIHIININRTRSGSKINKASLCTIVALSYDTINSTKITYWVSQTKSNNVCT